MNCGSFATIAWSSRRYVCRFKMFVRCCASFLLVDLRPTCVLYCRVTSRSTRHPSPSTSRSDGLYLLTFVATLYNPILNSSQAQNNYKHDQNNQNAKNDFSKRIKTSFHRFHHVLRLWAECLAAHCPQHTGSHPKLPIASPCGVRLSTCLSPKQV
jgi:hypothetical protein